MFLAEVKGLETAENAAGGLTEAIDFWSDCPASLIDRHGGQCCELALRWLAAMDYSQLNGDRLAGPRWIRARHVWGPTCWPVHWCEAIEAKTLDCGALASIALEAFRARGLTSHTAQLIQRYSDADGRHWSCNWEREGAHTLWIRGNFVYHEACAVVERGDRIRIWDPTASWWVTPKQFSGYGEVLAVRILAADDAAPAHFNWGSHSLVPNAWHSLTCSRADFA